MSDILGQRRGVHWTVLCGHGVSVCVCVCVHWEVMILCLNITWYWWRLSLASYFAIASLERVWANYHGLSVWHWTVIINIELFYSRIFQVVQCKRELLYWLHTISGLLLCWQTLGTCRVCTHTHICWINMPHPSLEVYSNIMGMDQLDHLVTVKSFQMSRSEVRSSQSHGTITQSENQRQDRQVSYSTSVLLWYMVCSTRTHPPFSHNRIIIIMRDTIITNWIVMDFNPRPYPKTTINWNVW